MITTSPPETPLDDDPTSRPRPRRWPVVVGVAFAIVAGLVVSQLLVARFSPRLYAGTVLQSDDPAPSMDGLSLARTGEPVDIAAGADQVTVVFFGYTNCPDVCPASMALTAQAMAGMGVDDQARVRVLLVTVDPDRDDPTTLQTYAEQFNPTFDGVTGPIDVIDRVATEYGVFYQYGDLDATPAPAAGDNGAPVEGYTVDHTASLFGIGPDGALRIVWPPSVTADELRADIESLLG